MSRYEAFCNITTDLQAITDISSYDRKRVLPNNWVSSPTTNLYYLHNAGSCSVVFKDGKDLALRKAVNHPVTAIGAMLILRIA